MKSDTDESYKKRFEEKSVVLELTPYEATQVMDGIRKMRNHWRESAEEQGLSLHAHRAQVCNDIYERIRKKHADALDYELD